MYLVCDFYNNNNNNNNDPKLLQFEQRFTGVFKSYRFPDKPECALLPS